jgi:short-subunit dehydrogenase
MRHIVISGASRGLGAALAQRFAAPGTRLFLTARSAEALAKVAEFCRDAGAEVEILACDIRDPTSLAPALLAFDDAAPVDLIIANAGTSSGSSLEGVPEAYGAAITQIEVNLIGAMALVGPLLPRLRGRGQGQIAVIASLAGLRGLPDSPAYSASKAGLIAWGEALRSAEATRGIGVTVIGPGFFESAMGNRFKGPRPFLLSLEEAAVRIAAGIRARKRRVFFPWPLAFALRLLVLLPAGLSDRAVRLLRFRVAPPEGEG